MTWAISSTSALAWAMRLAGTARVSSASGAGKRVSHQAAEWKRGSTASVRCSMVVPVRGRPTMTSGSSICIWVICG
ncbi:hypothetical protein D3C87_1556040 [compost metagenome]